MSTEPALRHLLWIPGAAAVGFLSSPQANLGNAIASVPTLPARNPLASLRHVAAVAHDPRSDLFLPPHDETAQP